MKPTRIQNPNHNPFHNRFHVPVHSRLDEMQAYTHMVWLTDPLPDQAEKNHAVRGWGRALAGAFAFMLVVVFSAALLSNAFGN